MKVDERVCAAALLLKHAPELAPFVDWLKARREAARDRLEAVPAHSDSGRALELKQILDFIEQSPQMLDKLRAAKK